MKKITVVNRRACGTCPFRKDAGFSAFPPEALDASIGENLRTGYAHNCHKHNGKNPKVCAGYARFVTEQNIPTLLLFARGLGVFDPETDLDWTTDFELSSFEAVKEMHRRRLEFRLEGGGL